jgi:excisionase family DNA binding protein
MQNITISGQFMTPDEAAQRAGKQTISIYSAIRRGVLKAIRVGDSLLISEPAYDHWFRNHAR